MVPDPASSTTLDAIEDPDRFVPLSAPPCSYCSTEARKGLIKEDDRALAWLRDTHNGGAIPLRQILSATRVLNDSHGLFFFDPDGDYVAAYEPKQGFRFHGWMRGAMVVESEDGSLWHALSGRAFSGPRRGERLKRIPSLVTHWGHWLMLHPESTTLDLFDGKTYTAEKLPTRLSSEAEDTIGMVDWRLAPLASVLAVEASLASVVFPLDGLEERACIPGVLEGIRFTVFWYAPTRTAVAFLNEVDGKPYSFVADPQAPETAPFKDLETGSRWTIAGRAVDGPLRGKELAWMTSIQSRWYAWVAQNPKSAVHEGVP